MLKWRARETKRQRHRETRDRERRGETETDRRMAWDKASRKDGRKVGRIKEDTTEGK